MTEMKVGSKSEVVHATIVSNGNPYNPAWRVLTADEIAAGCTGNPDDEYDSISERMEGMFVGTVVNRFLGVIGKLFKIEGFNDPHGFCSTYREWHILCRGFYSGFAAALGEKFTPCPEKWKDEAQYYEGGQELGYIVKNGKLWIPLTGVISSALTYVVMNYQTIIPMILALI